MGRARTECGGGAKGGSPFLAILVFLITLGVAALTYPSYLGVGKSKDSPALIGYAEALPQTIAPMRILVLPGPAGSFRLRLKVLDLSGQELSLLERSFQGPGLGLDFVTRRLAPAAKGGTGRTLLFPRDLYGYGESGEGPDKAILLDVYDRKGLPGIYLGAKAPTEAEAKALAKLFASVREDSSASRGVQILLPSPEVGAAYELRLGASGNPVLVKVGAF